MLGRATLVLLALGLVAPLSTQACAPSNDEESAAMSAERREREARAQGLVRGMMGLPETPAKDPSKGVALYEAVSAHVLDVLKERDAAALERFDREIRSGDLKRGAAAWTAMREALDAISASPALRARVASDPIFSGIMKPRSEGRGSIHPRADDPPRTEPIVPDLGRGPDGRFGDGRTGAGGAFEDLADGLVDPFTPWRTLEKIDRGELVPDPESRLGAYAATGGYPPGTVGNAVHRAIGAIYIALGNYGEERIGRVFNSPEARALYNQPVSSPAGLLMARIEERYWQNVRAEDSWSPGGQLGSAFSPSVRDWLQREVFATEAEPGAPNAGDPNAPGGGAPGAGAGQDGGALSPTDCGDKSDGWWCLDSGAGVGWMVYCSGKQISGGCPCAGCTTKGVRASCGASPPPAACPL